MKKIDDQLDAGHLAYKRITGEMPVIGLGSNDARQSATKNASRRDWLRRGVVVASPVVASLVSTPVFAGTCILPSGFVSANTFSSRHPNNPPICAAAARGPTYWIGLGAAFWPASAPKNTAKFSVFSPSDTTTTLFSKLSGGTELTRLSVAAYLTSLKQNSSLPPTGFPATLTPAMFLSVWQSFNGLGVPVTGLAKEADAIAWLKTLVGPS